MSLPFIRQVTGREPEVVNNGKTWEGKGAGERAGTREWENKKEAQLLIAGRKWQLFPTMPFK
jgi:hypothetical protein